MSDFNDELSRIGLQKEVEEEIRKNLREGNKAGAIHVLKQNFSCTLQQSRDILNNVAVISQADELVQKGWHLVKVTYDKDQRKNYVCVRCGKTEDWVSGELIGLSLSEQECK